MAKRLAPTKDTLTRLFALSGNVCAFPECHQRLFNHKNKFVGQVCHIAAASDGGERAKLNLTSEERRLPENLLILCYPHHVETDDIEEFTVERLQEMKKIHEDKFRGTININDFPPTIIDDMYNIEIKRLQALVTETLDNTKELLVNAEQQNLVNQELLKGMANLLARKESGEISNSNKTDFSAEIDSIMELRDSNQLEGALISFERLKARDWNDMTPHEKYRVLANMGIIYLQLDQQEKAGELFIEAISNEDSTVKSLSIGALGYILKKDRINAEICINRAWEIDPLNTDSWYAYVMLNKESIPYFDLIGKIPDEVKEDVEIATGLAQVASLNNLHTEAIKWSQIALDLTAESNYDAKAALATSILQSQIVPYDVLSEQVSENTKVKMRYVIKLLSEAWEDVRHTALSKSRAWWLINRGVANKFFPDNEAAFQDMLESCQHNETYSSLRHLAIAAFDTDRITLALDSVEKMMKIGGPEKEDEALLFRAELISQKGDHVEAQIQLEKYLLRQLNDANRYHGSLRLIDTYLKNTKFDEARVLNDKLLIDFPDKIRPYINKGKFSGNRDILKAELSKALAVVGSESSYNEVHDLVLWLQRIGEFGNAQTLMEKITNTNAYSDHTKELLNIYYQAGETAKLLKLSEDLLETYGPVDLLTEYKVVVYQNIGDYNEAIKTCLDYLNVYPDDQLIMIRLGLLYDKAGQLDSLKKLLSTFPRIDQNLPCDLQENLALLYFAIDDYANYYDILYEIRRQFIEDPLAHQRFVSLMLKPKKDISDAISNGQVEVNHAITVELPGPQYETFIIEDRRDNRPLAGELNLSDPIAKALLGKRIDEQVTIELPSGANTIRIVRIIPKYANAMRESFQLLTGKFIKTSGVKKFQIGTTGDPEEDLKPMTDLFAGVEEMHDSLTFYFRKEVLSLGAIAATTNRPVLEIWRQYAIDEQVGLINHTFYKEQERAFTEINAGKPIVFDIISLITISIIDAFDAITLLSNKKIVTQSTVDEITNQISRLSENRESGIVHLRSKKGQKESSFETPLQIQTQIENYQLLIEWIKLNCDVVPVTAAININAKEKHMMNDKIGESFLDSILTADEVNGILIAEERIIRAYAFENFNMLGGNIFTIAQFLKNKRLLIQDRFNNLSISLIGLNYKFVAVDAALLFKIALANEFELTDLFKKSVLGIYSNLILGDLAFKIVVEFFYKLYTETSGIITTLSELRTERIVNYVLKVLSFRFKTEPMKARLKDLIYSKLSLLPLQAQELITIIDNFQTLED